MRNSLALMSICALAASVSYSTLAFAAPSVGEVLEANRAATGGNAWNGKATLKIAFTYAGQGMTGTTDSLDDLKNAFWVDTFAIGPATGANGYDGEHGWQKDMSGTITLQDGGAQLPLAVNEAFRRANIVWRADRGGASVAFAGEKSESGVTYDVLTITPKGGKNFDVWIDAKTHLLSRIVEVQGADTTTTMLSDYRAVDGAEIPFKQIVGNGDPKYDQTFLVTNAVFVPEQPRSSYSAPKITVADFSIAKGEKETSFPFKLINNHIYADVTVNGKGPYQFIFDTGGMNVVTPPVATELGLKSEGHIQGGGAGAGHMDFSLTKVASLGLGDASVSNQIFIEAPLDSMAPIEGVNMPGMVGYEVFRRFVTRVDYGTNTITLIKPDSFDPKGAGTAIPIAFDGNTIEAEGSFDGIPGKFTIDTGSRSSLTLSSPFVARNNLAGQSKGIDAVTGWGVGGPTRSIVERGRELDIGRVKVAAPITELSTDKAGSEAVAELAGNIGGGVLKRYIVTFDYEHSTMYLKPVTTPVPDLDTFDRAGLWMNDASNGFKVIDVTKGAPADIAGLKADDIIVAVDGKPAKSIPLYELRKRLRNDAAGTMVKFTVKNATATREVSVTLRDLI